MRLIEICDISIPVSFGKKQLSAFGGAPARGEYFLDTRKGGSCNCGIYTFSPHLNGTHTEGVGHITKERISVPNVGLVEARLITVKPEKGFIASIRTKPAEALIVRTLPNPPAKKTRSYKDWPTFTPDAMKQIVRLGVKHLLVDLPSVDRMDDAEMANHRIFWRRGVTITELVYVPARVKDGAYLLNLQVAAFEADAAPSRPVLYKVKK
ncbi:MAG: cyclase family protein [Alphaproteobacteria bacterium]|nr:cyclase family protein [Alphaproteobacteria bacterium]